MSSKAEALRDRLAQLQTQKDSITDQVNTAKRRAAAEGIYANANWLSRAEVASRIIGRQISETQRSLGEALAAERAEQARKWEAERAKELPRFERAFLNAARRLLPEDSFRAICNEAELK